jgi:hypothetical protein
MNRAVLLIGVSRTRGDLSKLKAVESSIDKMVEWAKGQLIPENLIIRRTDADNPVTPALLFDEISKLAKLATINQLIIYFSGHGVVNNRQEYWLLSDAPENAGAAVNLDGNISLARAGAFDHVVFLSDACRTPTQGLQYSRIIGSDIFPNIVDFELERPVDVFFATALGAPALEVIQESRQYQAVFTEALLDALNGSLPEAISDGRVCPRPLKKALPKRVSDKLRASGLSLSTSQTPDARITSDDGAWLAEIPITLGALPPNVQLPAPPSAEKPGLMSTKEVAQLVVEEALRTDTFGRSPATGEEIKTLTGRSVSKNAESFLESMARSVSERRPQSMLSKPGFEICGRVVASAACPDGMCDICNEGDTIWVGVATRARHNQALLEFMDGTGVLLPVIKDFVGVLRFNERGLDQVWYEPANEYDASFSRRELEFLRQAISKASSLGVFALEAGDVDQLASRMQNAKFQDPALAIYAAYAFHDIGQFRRIGQMQEYLKSRMDVQLYDLALLSRSLLKDASLAEVIIPRLPMLSQGWALVDALRGRIPDELNMLRKQLTPSLWSLYTPEGTQMIRAWINQYGKETTVSITGVV